MVFKIARAIIVMLILLAIFIAFAIFLNGNILEMLGGILGRITVFS